MLTARTVRCRECGYDLQGIPSGSRCPECGKAADDSINAAALLRRFDGADRVGESSLGWSCANWCSRVGRRCGMGPTDARCRNLHLGCVIVAIADGFVGSIPIGNSTYETETFLPIVGDVTAASALFATERFEPRVNVSVIVMATSMAVSFVVLVIWRMLWTGLAAPAAMPALFEANELPPA